MQTGFPLAKRLTILLFFTVLCREGFCQYPHFSFATDLGVQRNFKKEQQYWAIGQTVHTIFHFTPKEAVYIWFCYYTNGNFRNDVIATGKDPFLTPHEVPYVNRSKMRLKQFSVGWKKYLAGAEDIEKGWSIYAYAGFGLLLGRVINTHSIALDTSIYNVPVLSGKANFKRLTVDVGLGWETPVGGDFFFYAEGRAWIPTTDYPSKFIFVNTNAPLVGMFDAGLRLRF